MTLPIAATSGVRVVIEQSGRDVYFALLGAFVVGALGVIGLLLQSRAEDRRLTKRLDHDREREDLELLRSVLSDGAEALGMVKTAYRRLMQTWANELPNGDPRRERATAEQRAAAARSRSVLDRLALYLPPEDAVFQSYKDAMLTLDEVADLLYSSAWREPYHDYDATVEELGTKLEKEMAVFAGSARARVGPQEGAPGAGVGVDHGGE